MIFDLEAAWRFFPRIGGVFFGHEGAPSLRPCGRYVRESHPTRMRAGGTYAPKRVSLTEEVGEQAFCSVEIILEELR